MNTGIMAQPIFEKLKPYFDIQVYDKDGGHKQPRIRIEFMKLPEELQREALDLKMGCVCCGDAISPIRARQPSKRGIAQHLYYAPTCPLATKIGCSRGAQARNEYTAIKKFFVPELA